MTRISAPILYQCPKCIGYFTRSVLTILHFYDDVPEWSDGMSGQWWARAGGPVGLCPACSGIVWIDDVPAVMEVPLEPRAITDLARLWYRMTGDRQGELQSERNWNDVPREIKEAKAIVRIQDARDLVGAIALLSPGAWDRELYLRRRLWWLSKDHQRLRADGTPVLLCPALSEVATEANMTRLLELVERVPEHQVERGELLRQFSRFDEAVAVLKAVRPDGYSEVKASKIQRLAQASDAAVHAL